MSVTTRLSLMLDIGAATPGELPGELSNINHNFVHYLSC